MVSHLPCTNDLVPHLLCTDDLVLMLLASWLWTSWLRPSCMDARMAASSALSRTSSLVSATELPSRSSFTNACARAPHARWVGLMGMHGQVRAHTHAHANACAHAHMRAHIRTQTYANTHTDTHTHIRAQTQTHADAHKHKNKHQWPFTCFVPPRFGLMWLWACLRQWEGDAASTQTTPSHRSTPLSLLSNTMMVAFLACTANLRCLL